MNNEDVINQIKKLTNIDHDTCATVIKAFESNSTLSSVFGNFLGADLDVKGMASTIANKTGIEASICEKILTVLTSTVKQGIKDKFNFSL